MKRVLLLASVSAVMSFAVSSQAADCCSTPAQLASLPEKPLYQSSEKDLDAYLHDLHASEPDIHKRMVQIARRNIDQPYELYLLGEAPFETTDNQPIYCLTKSDCVVFAEHTLAMALTDNFDAFLRMLQRIRYKNGEISVLTRNHYTEADWNKNNTWLVHEITDELAGENVAKFSEKVDRQSFFSHRYNLKTEIPVQTINETFIPFEKIDLVKAKLKDGDIVNFVSGQKGGYWVGHVGMVALGDNGEVHLIHSSAPKVREEKIEEYIARATKDLAEKDAAGKARFYGFKFLRLTDDPIANLRAIDGKDAPRVSVPKDSKVTFDDYLKQLHSKEISGNSAN